MKIPVFKWVFIFSFIFLPLKLLAETVSPSGPPLDARILENGDVIITDNGQEIAHLFLDIWMGVWPWPHNATFKPGGKNEREKGFNGVADVNGVDVDLKSRIEVLKNGLHVHYTLVPRDTVMVANVQARVSLPVQDWLGADYQLDQTQGRVVDSLGVEADSSSISLGPSHGGLKWQINATELHVVLFDERHWNLSNLVVDFTHNEPTHVPWNWNAGEEKNFDYTITFNRPLAAFGAVATPPAAAPGTHPLPLFKGCPLPPIDDFEDQTRNGKSPDRANLWGGHWSTVVASSTIGVTYNGPGHAGSRYSAGVTGYSGPGFAIFQCPLYAWGQPFNVVCHGMKGIQFWMKGNGSLYRVEVPNAAVTDGHDWYGYEFTAPAGEWAFFQVPFEKMTRRYTGSRGICLKTRMGPTSPESNSSR